MAKHKIALIPGDGIGKEVLPEGVRVLEAAARRFNFQLEFTDFDWSCDRLLQTGKMMPEDGMEQLKAFESIFLGAVGWPGVPDHVSLWGLLIPIRRDFDEYVNLRPVRLFEGVPSPLANRKPGDIDFWVVRENTEGEYSSVGGRMFEGTEREWPAEAERYHRLYPAAGSGYLRRVDAEPIERRLAAVRRGLPIIDRRRIVLTPEPDPEQLQLAI